MKTKSLLTLVSVSLVLGACGKMNDALNSTIAMNGKMDQTNNGMAQTNAGIIKTNQNMDKTNAAIDRTNAGMDKTNNAIHLQTLGVALDDILKPDAVAYVSLDSVTPTSMMVPGKIFAEEATQEEIAQLVYTYLLEINLGQPDTRLIDPKTSDYPDAVKNQTDLEKWQKFTALQVIAGLAPQATIDDMILNQITLGGRYEVAAYSVLYLRHLFIQTYLLDLTLMTEKMTDPGMFEEALKQVSFLKSIEKAPYAKSVQVQLYGYFDVGKRKLNRTWNLGTADVAKDYYPQLKSNLKDLDPAYKTSIDGTIETRVGAIKQQIEDGIAGH